MDCVLLRRGVSTSLSLLSSFLFFPSSSLFLVFPASECRPWCWLRVDFWNCLALEQQSVPWCGNVSWWWSTQPTKQPTNQAAKQLAQLAAKQPRASRESMGTCSCSSEIVSNYEQSRDCGSARGGRGRWRGMQHGRWNANKSYLAWQHVCAGNLFGDCK